MGLDYCRADRDGALLVITIDRQERLNALDRDGNLALSRLIDEFEEDPELRVAILTGAGERAFCVGNDLRQGLQGADSGMPETGFAGLTSRFDRHKPLIAAVNGLAIGGGFEMALACDLIIASENASFSLPEPLVGVAALPGGLQMLTRQIALKQAMGMILTGRSVSAAEGLRLGFVNEVVESAKLLATARTWAESIIRGAPLAITASMQAIQAGDGLPYRDAMARQAQCESVQKVIISKDRFEGARAFAEKRQPVWKGE